MAVSKFEQAIFAGGCFWCMVKPFHEWPGIIEVVSGYTGGETKNPTYEEVCEGKTGHTEAVKITYNPTIISYEKLLQVFWQQIDPTDPGGQFFDRGQSYKTAIFYLNEEQKLKAEQSKKELEISGRFSKPIMTKILQAKEFHVAEDYHQDYYKKNPLHYNRYFIGSGRAAFIERHWGGK